jgi:glycosyltransferase involved in cell wall biosynthesis
MMHVALVLAGPYPAMRGSQVLVSHLAEGLGQRGHVVHLVTYGAGSTAPSGPRVARAARDVALTWRLWRTVRRYGIDVIHAHNYEAALAGLMVARLTRRPLVYHGHNALRDELPTYFSSRSVRRLAGAVGRLLDAHVPRRADFCIAVSDDLRETLRRGGVRPEGLACIPPAGAPRELEAAPVPAESSGLVCYAGNLDGYQNLDFLLRSFARVRARVAGARLVVVTHADAKAEAARLRARAPGVEVVAATTYDDVRARLEVADVAVCPRTERSGFPMKLLNYMATGKAIVACAGSAKGLHDGVTGRVVPDDDEDAFAGAIADLLKDASERARLGAAARLAVEDMGPWNTVLDRIEAIYRSVLAAQASATGVLQAARRT